MRSVIYKLILLSPLLILLGCNDPPPPITPCFIHGTENKGKCYPHDQSKEPFTVDIVAMDEFLCLSVDDTSNMLRWIEHVKH